MWKERLQITFFTGGTEDIRSYRHGVYGCQRELFPDKVFTFFLAYIFVFFNNLSFRRGFMCGEGTLRISQSLLLCGKQCAGVKLPVHSGNNPGQPDKTAVVLLKSCFVKYVRAHIHLQRLCLLGKTFKFPPAFSHRRKKSRWPFSAAQHIAPLSFKAIFHSSQQTEQCAICEMMLKLYSNSLFVRELALQNCILINAKFLQIRVLICC